MSNDSTSSSIFEICKNINSYPQCFYGAFSRLSMEITMDGTLRVGIAPILDEMKGKTGGKITPGTKMYDDNKKAVFTLNNDNVAHIMRHWKAIRTNTFQNLDPKCKAEYANKFSLVHYGDNNASSTFALTAKDDINKLTVFIKGQDGNQASFQLSNDEVRGIYTLLHFENVLKKVGNDGMFEKLSFQAIIKRLNSALYKINSPDGNNNNNRGRNNSNYNNNNNNNGGGGNSNYNNNRNNYNNNNNNNNQNAPQQSQQRPVQNEPIDVNIEEVDHSELNSMFSEGSF